MVAVIQRQHDIKWLAPSPLWSREGIASLLDKNGAFGQPAIMRFNHDLFMDEFLSLLAHNPEQLGEWVAEPETWREPMPTPPTASRLTVLDPVSKRSRRLASVQNQKQASVSGLPAQTAVESDAGSSARKDLPFKLYQPAQQRFYLVSAALVCRERGLPDRTVDAGKQEQVSFVFRRVVHRDKKATQPCDPSAANCDEYAYVNTVNGYAWKLVDPSRADHVETDEERIPLFGIHYDERDQRRRLFAGLIPVGKREAYVAAHLYSEVAGSTADGQESEQQSMDTDSRVLLFEAQVTEPWKALLSQVQTVESALSAPPDPAPTASDNATLLNNFKNTLQTTRNKLQTISWYILLDFAKFLESYLGNVWKEINSQPKERPLTPKERTLYEAIGNTAISAGLRTFLQSEVHASFTVETSLANALRQVHGLEADLEQVVEPLDLVSGPIVTQDPTDVGNWPNIIFPLANPAIEIDTTPPVHQVVQDLTLAGPVPAAGVDISGMDRYETAAAQIDGLAALIADALPAPTGSEPELEPIRQPWDNRDAWFVIRCVYERPHCGPFHPVVVSRPTEPFQMASFFDSDAPARPIRIPMPLDISPAGLRKYKKNTLFQISDMLCGKIKGVRKLTLGDLVLSVLPWPFHKDLPDVGSMGPCKENSSPIGLFCSLSIPIVTLCALILLFIIVALLDSIFRWLPFLFFCLPIPGLKGKKNG